MRRHIFSALVLLLIAQPSYAQFTKARPIATLPQPVLLDTTAMFQAMAASVGEDVFITGQPTEQALRELKARGVTTVVNLRMPDEMERAVKFDEAKLVQELGMKYVHIPVRAGTTNPYSPAAVVAFSEAMKNADGKVLLHCTLAWRASHLWAAYLIERGVADQDALANARAIRLQDTNRANADPLPVEGFLGRTPQGLGKPRE